MLTILITVLIIPHPMMMFLPVRIMTSVWSSVVIDQDIINMPANVHDSNNNDILMSTIDPGRCINGTTKCHYFDSNEFNTKFNKTVRFSIFHTNIRSSKHNINHMMCYLNSINMDFSIIGLSETWGTSIHIDMQNIPGYEHYYCI